MTTNLFSTLPLSTEFLANLESLEYLEMTPIQEQSLPLIIAGKDIKAQAKTGSGKTAAFGIGLLHKLNVSSYKTQALIICPTRELADQVSKELRRLARSIANTKIITLCGGVAIGPQFASLERDPHIVVGTPGRLLKHLEKGSLNLDQIQTLVLDEADRMLDMGFLDDIKRIINKIPKQRQTLLFSATYPNEIEKISRVIQQDPENVQVESLHDENVIKQIFYETESGKKSQTLVTLLRYYGSESSVVFCNRKEQCQDVCNELRWAGFNVLALHGDLDQKERDQVLIRFINKSTSVLVATDVAARGLDIKDLGLVVNYELSPDPEIYIHRIGRTGRAGNEGLAISLFSASEIHKVHAIEDYQKTSAKFNDIPDQKSDSEHTLKPTMVTLSINGGRKNKMRPGDMLGALTANKKIAGNQIGKIDISDHFSYVAVNREVADQAFKILSEEKIKGRQYKARKL